MRLDPYGGGNPVAHVDDAGVLTRSDENPWRLGGETPEVDTAALVGAVLGPHHRVHGKFERVGRTIQDLVDPPGFVVGQAEGTVEGLAHGTEP